MVRKPDSDRIGKMLGLPSSEILEGVRATIAEEAVVPEEEWETYTSSADRSTPGTLFSNPPERFIAKLKYGDLVYCWLLEDNDELGYLCYLCNTGSIWTTVYVYKGICPHQTHLISTVYGLNDVDWRVVPITARNSNNEFARKNSIDWSAWIFHHYFGFDSFTEPD